ncbi:hypothetical protein HYU17_05030 [Candidatus Woesearchaeota archaeon]|nr:hypothetical protein [Candidatus Woesearchaeota archaeon]
MHIWLHKIEVLVDRLIPPVLAAMLIVIVGEFFFSHQFEWYRHYADFFDGFVVLLFAADLGFKYSRIRKLPIFARKYWLEIIATIPFFLIFRVLEFFKVSDFFETGQVFAHEGLAAGKVEKEVAMIAKEAVRAGEASRTAKMVGLLRAIGRFPRVLRILIRSPRLLSALHFFEKPTGQHYWHEKAAKTKKLKAGRA